MSLCRPCKDTQSHRAAIVELFFGGSFSSTNYQPTAQGWIAATHCSRTSHFRSSGLTQTAGSEQLLLRILLRNALQQPHIVLPIVQRSPNDPTIHGIFLAQKVMAVLSWTVFWTLKNSSFMNQDMGKPSFMGPRWVQAASGSAPAAEPPQQVPRMPLVIAEEYCEINGQPHFKRTYNDGTVEFESW